MFDACAWQCRQAPCVFSCVADIGDERRSAGLCHAPDFFDSLFSTFFISDVVNCETARDDIEAQIWKRQSTHVARVQFDPLSNALELGVAQRRLLTVSRLIPG
jgi:hypothetical protein